MSRPTRVWRAIVVVLAATASLLVGGHAQADERISVEDELRVISWNICGEAGGSRGATGYCPHRNDPGAKVAAVVSLVSNHQANVLMLQEACGYGPDQPASINDHLSHLALLRAQLGPLGWNFVHAAGNRPDFRSDCRKGGEPARLGGNLGVILGVKGELRDAQWFDTIPKDHPDPSIAGRVKPALCARAVGLPDKLCTTHLLADNNPVRAMQVEKLKSALAADFATGLLLGGDLNANESSWTLRPLTDALHRCANRQPTYQTWPSTEEGPSQHRLDHLLSSRVDLLPACRVHRPAMDTTQNVAGTEPNGFSDHAPVIGYHRMPGDLTGDGTPDLIAVDDAGKLRMYPGEGTGALGSHAVIGSTSWLATSVTHRGDWSGDGDEDIIARVGQQIRLFPNRGGGAIGDHVVLADDLPADTRIVSVGDVTGDGEPDLIASHSDKLFRYEYRPGPSLAEPVIIGTGGWDVMEITAPGDADGDGRVDLLSRDTRDGTLWLYRGRGDGGFGDRTRFGHGYGTASRPLLAGGADADGNGIADMWSTTDAGTLLFYAGNVDAEGNPVDGTRSQVGASGWGRIRSIS